MFVCRLQSAYAKQHKNYFASSQDPAPCSCKPAIQWLSRNTWQLTQPWYNHLPGAVTLLPGDLTHDGRKMLRLRFGTDWMIPTFGVQGVRHSGTHGICLSKKAFGKKSDDHTVAILKNFLPGTGMSGQARRRGLRRSSESGSAGEASPQASFIRAPPAWANGPLIRSSSSTPMCLHEGIHLYARAATVHGMPPLSYNLRSLIVANESRKSGCLSGFQANQRIF